MITQNMEGSPVAIDMLRASVWTEGPKGDERKKTVLRSVSAFRTHWTARKLKKNVATFALAKRAMRTSPTINIHELNRTIRAVYDFRIDTNSNAPNDIVPT